SPGHLPRAAEPGPHHPTAGHILGSPNPRRRHTQGRPSLSRRLAALALLRPRHLGRPGPPEGGEAAGPSSAPSRAENALILPTLPPKGAFMKALILVADGFDDLQLFCPWYRLQEEGLAVTLASPGGQAVTGQHGYRVEVDTPIHELNPSEYDLLLIP